MALTYVNLTLDLYDGSGNPLKAGTATLVPSALLTDTVDHELITQAPISVTFVPTGLPIVRLTPTDDADIQPRGWVWTISFNGVPGNPPSFSFALPAANGSSQYLSAQAPLQSAPAFNQYLTGSYPGDSSLVLDGAGQWIPMGGTSSAVTSVNTKTGAVVLTPADIGAAAANAVVTSVNGAIGDVSLGAADLGAIPSGSVGTMNLVATTAPNGFSLQNGTPVMATYNVPDDGNVHRLFVAGMRVTSTALTGGTLVVTGTAPDGSAISVQVQGGGQPVGTTAGNQNIVVQGGSVVNVSQGTAATAGAAKQFVDVWEWIPSAQVVTSGGGGGTSNALLYGTDNGSFSNMLSVIPQTKLTRVYSSESNGVNGVPATFPGNSHDSRASHMVVSFRPDVSMLLAGSLDASIGAYMAAAPAGTYLCAYHEANLSTNWFRTTGHTASDFTAAQAKLKALRDAHNPNIKLGQILLASSTANQASPWVAPGLDWYGLDGYAGSTNKTAATVFDTAIQNILNVVPDAVLAIPETNAGQGTNAQWNQWFTDVFSIAHAHNMAFVLTWWGANASSTPPAFVTNGPYVPTLQQLCNAL